MLIIGVDCAVAPENTGVVLARWEGTELIVRGSEAGSDRRSPLQIILESLEAETLIAMDAPLGWPARFGELLAAHEAGEGIPETPYRFFRRRTDDLIAARLGKRPMDVAADRIGRTAFAALEILQGVRLAGRRGPELAWSPAEAAEGVHVIETYPAGWLKATGLPAQGYKRREQRWRREQILDALKEEVKLETGDEPFLRDPDQLDALLCAVSAVDFLRGIAVAPEPDEMERAKKEGWIWLRR